MRIPNIGVFIMRIKHKDPQYRSLYNEDHSKLGSRSAPPFVWKPEISKVDPGVPYLGVHRWLELEVS